MSIRLFWEIFFGVMGDGETTVFTLDLAHDPYLISGKNAVNGDPSIEFVNWFSNSGGNKPTGVGFVQGGPPTFTASLSGTVLTITFATAPPANTAIQCGVTLLWD